MQTQSRFVICLKQQSLSKKHCMMGPGPHRAQRVNWLVWQGGTKADAFRPPTPTDALKAQASENQIHVPITFLHPFASVLTNPCHPPPTDFPSLSFWLLLLLLIMIQRRDPHAS